MLAMSSDLQTLPESRQELVKIIDNLTTRNEQLEEKVRWFEEQFHLARHKQFGASSERSVTAQGDLFNEAEVIAEDGPVEEHIRQKITYERKKPGRRPIPKDLPIERIEYRLPEEEQICTACGGHLHEMSEELRHEVKLIPAQVRMVQHARMVYGCRNCEKNGIEVPIKTAKAPRPVIEKGLASPSAAAYVMTMKFVEGVPLYRQEQHYARMGIDLSRGVISNWMLKSSEWLELIYGRLKQKLIESEILHADETTLQVLKEPGKAAESQSYMWLYRTGSTGPPIVLFEYQPSRAGEHPRKFLAGFKGYLQVDGYAGYHDISDVVLCGCWAHLRRKFDEALKGLPPKQRVSGTKTQQALEQINKLFMIERELKQSTAEERLRVRNLKSRPIVEEFRKWLDEVAGSVLTKSLFGIAVNYGRQQWPKLVRFLEDGRIELHNNAAERSIKPFVIGRKNWLFANTPRGARASAVIYSIVESAKENGLNPYAYLTHLFERLPNLDSRDNDTLDPLLPWNVRLQSSSGH
jgi:transposase